MDVNRDATVDEEGPAPTPTPPNDAPRLQRLVMVCSVAGVIALGGLALGATVVHERDTVAGREQQAADQAAAVVRERLVRSVSALQGVRGLAVDGTVTPAEFDAYAADALAAADFPWLARHVAVDGDRRAAWEAANGVEIVDRADSGDGPDGAAGGDGLVRAPERNRYAPVVAVSPAQASGRAPRGLDLLGERSAVTAAEESAERDRPTVTDAMPLPDGGGPAFLVVEALTAPDPAREGGGQRVVGYVSGSLPVADLAAGAAAGLPDGTSVALLDGDRPLAGDGEGKRADVSAAGTSLVVAVDTPTNGNATLPLVVALVTVAATALVVFSFRRDRQAQAAAVSLADRLQADRAREARLAAVAHRLSFTGSVEAVIDVVTTDLAAVTGAAYADLGILDDAEHLRMSHRTAPLHLAVLERHAYVPLDAHLPTTEALRERRIVTVPDLAAYQRDHPDLLADVRAAGVATAVAAPLFGIDGEPIAVLLFVWPEPAVVDEGILAVVETLARMCGQALRRSRLSQRTTQLAELAAAMATATTPADVARLLVDHACGALGAVHANLRLLDLSAGTLEPLLPPGLDPDIEARYRHIPLSAPVPVAEAVRLDAAVWLPDLESCVERYPDALDDFRAVGFVASASVPLHDSTGTPHGVVAIAWPAAMRFDHELVTTITTLADLTAQTLERTLLAHRHQQRAESLGHLAQALATTLSTGGIAAAVAEHAPALLDAQRVRLALVAGNGPSGQLVVAGEDPEEGDDDVDVDLGVVVGGGGVDGVDGVDGHGDGRRWARAGDGRRRRGGTTDVVLRDPEGQRRGVLLVHRSGPPAPDPARDALQATVAELVGQTLERVALHEGEHAVVAALQRRLLPPAPAVAGLDVAVHYQPASGEVGMGGDWYDAIALEDGSLVVVLGDVTGHGVDAVASMAQLQYLIAGLVRTGTPLSRIFAQANAMLGDEDTFATAQLIHVDHRWHRMGHLSAGHPPVLLRRPDGEVQVVTDARQSLIGVPLEPQPLAYVPCPPGSLVLAYTDGLIERRGRPITAGVDVLAADLAGASPDTPADDLLRQVVERARRPDASGAALDDDIAAVLIRVVT